MTEMQIRPMQRADRSEVAELICVSTNYWYEKRGNPPVFPGGPESTDVYFDVYEALDPGCGVVAEDPRTGRLMGSVFLHPRSTHVSLGIMNVHPNHFGKGVASAMLQRGMELADRESKPLRLVSGARNLDSFSLYTRAGLVPRCVYQGMCLEVPEAGLALDVAGEEHVREARVEDVDAMAAIEMELVGIRRDADLRYLTENSNGFWHVSVFENDRGELEGFSASSAHRGCNMIGPGVAKTSEQAAALLITELKRHRGRQPGFLIPAERDDLVSRCYGWGARNFEIALGQVRGRWQPPRGVTIPTFLPETA